MWWDEVYFLFTTIIRLLTVLAVIFIPLPNLFRYWIFAWSTNPSPTSFKKWLGSIIHLLFFFVLLDHIAFRILFNLRLFLLFNKLQLLLDKLLLVVQCLRFGALEFDAFNFREFINMNFLGRIIESRIVTVALNSEFYKEFICVYLMASSAMSVLLWSLTKKPLTALHRTWKGTFTSVNTRVIDKCSIWLNSSVAYFTHEFLF